MDNQNFPQENPNQNPVQNPNPAGGLAVASLVLGIVGLVFAFLFVWIGLICSVIGLVFAIVAKNNGNRSGMRTAGFVLSIIGLILSLILLIAAIACVSIIGAGIAGMGLFK